MQYFSKYSLLSPLLFGFHLTFWSIKHKKVHIIFEFKFGDTLFNIINEKLLIFKTKISRKIIHYDPFGQDKFN